MKQSAFWRNLAGALLLIGFLAGAEQAQETKKVYELGADGLTWPFCAYGVEKQLNAIKGVEAAETNVVTGAITLTMNVGESLGEDTAREAVEAAGFTMRSFKQRGAGE